MRLKPNTGSAGQVIDAKLYHFTLTPRGLWDWFRNVLGTVYSMGMIRSKLKAKDKKEKFSKRKLLQQAKDMYSTLNEGIAKQDHRNLRSVSTEHFLKDLENKMLDRKAVWTVEGLRATMEHARLIRIPKTTNEIAQICITFESRQTLTVVDREGKVIAGNQTPQEVVERLVLERPLHLENTSWRFCGRV